MKLTESDIKRIVNKVINEQEDVPEIKEFNKYLIWIDGANSSLVQKILKKLPNTIKFLTISNCESADFTNVDICSLENLLFVNLKNTPNNFEESVDCDYDLAGKNMYDLSNKL